jgi:UDP-N-acetylglucosamine 2-epimerase (non-hydrolysing)
LCDYCFAPTETSKNNLIQEHIDPAKIFITGNTVIDALLMALDIIKSKPELQRKIATELKEKGYQPKDKRKFILVTGHRRENFGEGFLHICKALKEIAVAHPDMDIVYPVHLNPNVQKPVYELLANINNIYLIAPLDYLPFVYVMQRSYLILTDSGGVQEEAPSLGKPVLVMRDTTERPEAVEVGTVKLVGTDAEVIVGNVELLIKDKEFYNKMAQAHNPYGDGKACERIVNTLK